MYKILSKYGLAVSLGVALLMIVIAGLVYNSASESYVLKATGEIITLDDNNRDSVLSFTTPEDEVVGEVGALFYNGYILMAISVVLALVIFPIKSIIAKPVSAIPVVAGIAVMGIVYLIFSLSASTELTDIMQNMDEPPSAGDLKFTAGIIGSGIVLIVLSVVALIGSEIYKLVK